MSVWLVVGLGNPGERYASTRHNLGQMVIDALARRCGVTLKRHRTQSVVAETRFDIGHDRVVLAKPLSFMNNSGGAVAALAQYFGVEPERVIIIHDELDVPLGQLKLKLGGSGAGHNGIKDVIRALGTDQFIRVKVGVDRPPSGAQAEYVLSPFRSNERGLVELVIDDAADAVETITSRGLSEAQNVVHGVKRDLE